MIRKESRFQADLKKRLLKEFPGAYICKTDANQTQGIPDLLILYKKRWAMLECKRCSSASHRPNQDRQVERFDEMSFARFIYPENEEDVINELREAFGS